MGSSRVGKLRSCHTLSSPSGLTFSTYLAPLPNHPMTKESGNVIHVTRGVSLATFSALLSRYIFVCVWVCVYVACNALVLCVCPQRGWRKSAPLHVEVRLTPQFVPTVWNEECMYGKHSTNQWTFQFRPRTINLFGGWTSPDVPLSPVREVSSGF